MGRRKGYTAAVLICRVRVEVRGVVLLLMGRSVNGLGTRDVVWGEIRAGGRGGLVEVWWGRETVTNVGFGCSYILINSCRCQRGLPHRDIALFFAPFALTLAVRPSRTTRGCWGTIGAEARLALF